MNDEYKKKEDLSPVEKILEKNPELAEINGITNKTEIGAGATPKRGRPPIRESVPITEPICVPISTKGLMPEMQEVRGQPPIMRMNPISEALHRQSEVGIRSVDDFDEDELIGGLDIPANVPKYWTFNGKMLEVVPVRMPPDQWPAYPLHQYLLPITQRAFCPPMNPEQFDSEGFLRMGDVITFLCPKKVFEAYKKSTRKISENRNRQMTKPVVPDKNLGGFSWPGAEHEVRKF